MRYELCKLTLECGDLIEITKVEFDKLALSMANLLESLGIEEKFNLVIENYAEYERQLLDEALDDALFARQDWFSLTKRTYRINRRLVNLLTVCRLYVDQTSYHVGTIFGKESGMNNQVKQKMSEEYDANLGYRVMEALRNYVQHRGLPIHKLTMTRACDAEQQICVRKHIPIPSMKISRLKEDKKFKRSVLDELAALGEEVDLRLFVRDYMISLGRIHNYTRNLLQEPIADWDRTVNEGITMYKERFGDAVGLAIVKRNDCGEIVKSVYLVEDVIERRSWLEKKNKYFNYYANYVATNEVSNKFQKG